MSESTTRAGTAYKRIRGMEDLDGSVTNGGGVEETRAGRVGEELPRVNDGGVPAMMQILLEERRQREAEQAEERRKWELEMRVRDEEIGRRDEYNRRQMELLQSLVQGVQMQGENASRRATEVDKDVKMPKLTAEDDIVAYLTTFERLMRAYEVKRERWVFKLATNLIGKAQQAYAGLSTEDANNYDKVKEAILQRYDITEESYRQRFRVAKRKLGESNKEIVARLNDLASKWLKSCKSPEEVRDKIVLEQFLNMQSEELKVFIRERKPSSSEEAGRLADDYFRARKESVSERDRRSQESRRQEKPGRHCLKCGNSGHLARDCRTKMEKANDWREKPKPKWDPKDMECHNCHKKGHYSFNCPHRAMFCTERKMEVSGQISVVKRPVQSKPGVVKSGRVEGEAVDDILLDTGCSRTLVHRKLVPKEKAQDGEAVAIRCAHGDTVLYPLAKISLEVDGKSIVVEAAVSETLPMSVLLGTDIPELTELLQTQTTEQAFVAVTRAASVKKRMEKEEYRRKEESCGVQPKKTNLTKHRIITKTDRPVKLPAYRLPHAYRETVLKELEEMEKSGVIEPSQSEWAAPIVIVKKKDGSLRICVDYRRLNSVTAMDAYPMPRTDELIDKLGKAKYITTLDLARGYWQVPMNEEDKDKTAFITPKGLYQFRVMPFGLCGAPATFQRMMDRVIRGLESSVAVYLDDVVIFSETWDDHIQHVREVLKRLREYKLTAKPTKCQFGMHECVYLGHVVGNGQVKPDPEKLSAVKNYLVPKTKKGVRSFLGLTGYYRRFIADYAKLALPLSDLTKKSLPDKVQWTQECENAFGALKQALCNSPILQNPDFGRRFLLQTDASDRGVGAVLSQKDDTEQDRPIAYFSRKLLPRECRYSTVEKECLAIKLGVEAFKVYLLGKEFTIQTDHRALVWLNRLREKNARLTRWSLALQDYKFDVVHRAGTANGNADALSRTAYEDTTD